MQTANAGHRDWAIAVIRFVYNNAYTRIGKTEASPSQTLARTLCNCKDSTAINFIYTKIGCKFKIKPGRTSSPDKLVGNCKISGI